MSDPLDRVRAFFAEEDPPAGRRHGRFDILRELGRGGSGVVYEAVDPTLKRRVALKVLIGGSLERLRREAEAAARLQHPNVVGIYEVGPDYLAMEYIDGRPGVPDLATLLTVARAAAHAHAHGVVHRDLKPGNVMVAVDGRVVLTDFGLARVEGGEALTRTGSIAGTPVYMAPEQVRGETIGPATDVWALGVMLYELERGKRPFDRPTPAAVYEAIQKDEPEKAGPVAARALEKDPARRYPDAGAFADDLARQMAGEPVTARAPGAATALWRKAKRRPLPILAAATALLALAGALALQLWMSERDRSVAAFRAQARTALEAALELRRAGANARMQPFLDSLEAAYRGLGGRGLAEVEYLMGRMHRALNNEARALYYQERALAADPGLRSAHFERALLLMRRHMERTTNETEGDIDLRRLPPAARAELAGALEAAGKDATAEGLAARGYQALLAGTWDAARQRFRESLAADPRFEEAREGLASVLRSEVAAAAAQREAAWAEAEALYARGLEADKGYVPHYLARGQLRWSRGSARRHRGLDPMSDYLAAEEDFAKAVELAPGNPDAWTWRGESRVYQGIYALEMGWDARSRLEAAEADFARALAVDPAWSRAWFWRGNARFYRALWLLERGLDPLPDLEAGDVDLVAAVRLAKEPVQERRWRGRLRAQLGAARARAGKDPEPAWRAGEEDFKAAEARDPWLYTWWSSLDFERALAGRGPWEAAERRVSTALDINPRFDEGYKQRALIRMGRAATLSGEAARTEYQAAAVDFEQALAINPNFKHQIGDRLERARRKSSE